MLKVTVELHAGSDAEYELGNLKTKGEAAGLTPDVVDQMCSQARDVIGSLLRNAALLAQTGGTMRVTRQVVGPQYEISIVSRTVTKQPFLTRLRRVFGSH